MKAIPLRRILSVREESNRPDLQVLSVYRDHGVVPKASRADNFNKTPIDVTRYLHVRSGDLVVNKMKAWSGSVAVSGYEGIVSGDYLVCEIEGVEPRFLHFALRSPRIIGEMRMRSRGIRPNQERLYWDDLASIEIGVPSASEQRRIVTFLDDRVTRIDQIIAARREQMTKLSDVTEARLQALQDGLVATHGEARLGRLIVGLEQGWSPQTDGIPAKDDEWGVMRSGCVNGGVFKPSDNKRLPAGVEPRREYELRGGDLLMSRASGSLDLIGSVAVVPKGTRDRLLLCDKVYRIAPAAEWRAQFLAPMMRSRSNRARIRRGVSGAEGMANNLPSGLVRDLRIPLVPRSDQDAVIRQSDQARELETEGIERLTRFAELMNEYRTSLIAAAVTGELDVTTAGSGVPA